MLRMHLGALKAAFADFDLDSDGHISKVELMAVMKNVRLPIRHAELNELFRRYDPDNHGSIDFPEFCELITLDTKLEPPRMSKRRPRGKVL